MGLYNIQESWGYDFFNNAISRICNDPEEFTPESLDDVVYEGKAPLPFPIPKFLLPTSPIPKFLLQTTATVTLEQLDDDRAWFFYYNALWQRVRVFHAIFVGAFLLVYMFLSYAAAWILKQAKNILGTNQQESSNPKSSSHGIMNALCQMAKFGLLSYGVWLGARSHVDSTQWAKDLRHNRLNASVLEHEAEFGVKSHGWTTLPIRHDILLEHRIGGSHYFGIFKDMIYKGHHGNAQLQQMIKQFESPHGKALVLMAKDQLVEWLLVQCLWHENQARFLEQGQDGKWFLMSHVEAKTVLEHRLLSQVLYPVLHRLTRDTLEPLVSEWRFGIYQTTAMAHGHAVPVLHTLEERLYNAATTTAEEKSLNRKVAVPTSTHTRVSSLSLQAHPMSLDWQASGEETLQEVSSIVDAMPCERFRRSFCLQKIPSHNGHIDRSISPTSTAIIDADRHPTHEPAPGAWMHSGSLVKIQRGAFFYFGIVVEAFPNASYQLEIMDETRTYASRLVHRFHPNDLVGQEIQVRLFDEEDVGKKEYEDCVVTQVEFEPNNLDPKNIGAWWLTVQFSDGEVVDDVAISEIRRRK